MPELSDTRLLEPAPTSHAPADTWTVPEGLCFDAATREQLRALLDMGFTTAQLRSEHVLDCSDASLRKWLDGNTTPRETAQVVLDDLRIVVVALGHAGIRGPRAVKWLFARNLSRWTEGRRPIELLRPEPLKLLAAVQDLLYADESEPPSGVHLHVQPADPATAPDVKRRRRSRSATRAVRTEPAPV